MIGLLIGSLLLTPVSASVSDNLNSALVSVLSKLGESSASIAANTTSLSDLSNLSSIDEKLDKISNSLEKLSISQSMASAGSVKFENASWKSIHSVLQSSSLEDYTWSVGDTKMMGSQKVVITKITYNADGTPDEIDLGMQKAVTKTGYPAAVAWCTDEAYKLADSLTNISGLGKTGHIPNYGEIDESISPDVHVTSTYHHCDGGDNNRTYHYYLSNGGSVAIHNYDWMGWDAGGWKTTYLNVNYSVVPVITIW